MTLYFVTSNKNKFEEARRIIPDLEMLELDLDEIQELDSEKIIAHKLNEAKQKVSGNVVVEDISFCIKALNGFPGPLVKWLRKAIENEGIVNIMKDIEDKSVVVICRLGALINGEIKFFVNEIEGEIVEPKGESGFGFDPIFKPKNSDKTFAEMSDEEKEKYNMRARVFEELRDYIK